MKKKSLFMATLATISASGALFATSANANAAMDHKIVLNDTLWGLSKKYNVTIDALKKYNKLSSDTIYVGDTLKVPTKAEAALATAKTHRVVKGDTLWSLAKKYGTTVSALKKLNNLTSDTIYIGQTLILHANLNTYGVGGATISSNSSKAANDNAGYGAVSSTTTASVTTKQPEKSAKPAPAKKAEPKAKASADTDTSAKKNAESTDSTKTDASTSANATTDYSANTADTSANANATTDYSANTADTSANTSATTDYSANTADTSANTSATTDYNASAANAATSSNTANTTSAAINANTASKSTSANTTTDYSTNAANTATSSNTANTTSTATNSNAASTSTAANTTSASTNANGANTSTASNTTSTATNASSQAAVSQAPTSTASQSSKTTSVQSAAKKTAKKTATPKAAASTTASATAGSITSYAMNYLGVPYVWGGTTPAGFDCSGFVQYVYSHFGVNLGRTTYTQQYAGTKISVADAQAGDLYFWGSYGSAYHVAIALGGGQYVMAPAPGQSVMVGSVSSYTPSFAVRVL